MTHHCLGYYLEQLEAVHGNAAVVFAEHGSEQGKLFDQRKFTVLLLIKALVLVCGLDRV